MGKLPWWIRRLAIVPPVAITFGTLVWVAPEWYAPTGLAGLELIAHELTHVVQYRRHGCFGFTVRYGLDFLANLLRGNSLAQPTNTLPSRSKHEPKRLLSLSNGFLFDKLPQV